MEMLWEILRVNKLERKRMRTRMLIANLWRRGLNALIECYKRFSKLMRKLKSSKSFLNSKSTGKPSKRHAVISPKSIKAR